MNTTIQVSGQNNWSGACTIITNQRKKSTAKCWRSILAHWCKIKLTWQKKRLFFSSKRCPFWHFFTFPLDELQELLVTLVNYQTSWFANSTLFALTWFNVHVIILWYYVIIRCIDPCSSHAVVKVKPYSHLLVHTFISLGALWFFLFFHSNAFPFLTTQSAAIQNSCHSHALLGISRANQMLLFVRT